MRAEAVERAGEWAGDPPPADPAPGEAPLADRCDASCSLTSAGRRRAGIMRSGLITLTGLCLTWCVTWSVKNANFSMIHLSLAVRTGAPAPDFSSILCSRTYRSRMYPSHFIARSEGISMISASCCQIRCLCTLSLYFSWLLSHRTGCAWMNSAAILSCSPVSLWHSFFLLGLSDAWEPG